ncbi:MAG TPA: alginate export family protein, partial [Woeseiaceae bacterium]|nr:alginate export family protein [Woeseiaceae bacterium]
WLSLAGSYRLRYEHMENTFRVVGPAQDELLVSRLRLHARATGERFYGGIEIEDSRAWLEQDLTPVGTDDVNALEPLRVYAGYRTDKLDVQVGRMTMDVGSRRFVARNRTRNTTNAFTGVNAVWTLPGGRGLQAFLTMPVARLPNNIERDRLRSNDFELDQEHGERTFWGLYLSGITVSSGFDTDWYLFGIKEKDRPGLPTRNRDFLTAGLRVRKAADSWAFEFETALQSGEARATALPADVTDLDHRAWFAHAELSRDLAGRWEPSVILRFDYASGDKDPDDGEFNRFDTLFGARRWEFGVTGIHGVFARSNIVSPGIGLRLKPRPSFDLRFDYRPAWLASDRDFLTTAGLRDRDGNSGSFIGQQLDVRWRWLPEAANLSVDVTAAYLWKGEFLTDAPLAPPADNTIYWYVSTTLTF